MKRTRVKNNHIMLLLCVLMAALCVVLGGCGKSGNSDDSGEKISLYYLDMNGTSVVKRDHTLESTNTEEQIEEVINALKTPEDTSLLSPISDFSVQRESLSDGKLTVSFSSEYENLGNTGKTLCRTAVVLSLLEIPGINSVEIRLGGEGLLDEDGKELGPLTKDDFILNMGTDISSYEKRRLHLYFTDETGTKLVDVYRPVVYNSNISKEKLIVEEILKGPNAEGVYPTVNPSSGLISVTSKDGVCFVNFDKNFLTEPYSVTPEVAIYSIVDSLTELEDVSKVQISIDSDPSAVFMDKIPLQTAFSRDLDLMNP